MIVPPSNNKTSLKEALIATGIAVVILVGISWVFIPQMVNQINTISDVPQGLYCNGCCGGCVNFNLFYIMGIAAIALTILIITPVFFGNDNKSQSVIS
jgi:predicted metal-binding membrane protein